MELVIEGRYYHRGGLKQGCIGIEGGRIVNIQKVLRGDTHIDVGSRIILPGGIDPHVHFREPGLTNKENFYTGSLGALHAGISCVLEMPNTKPPVIDSESLSDKKRALRKKSFVDYGLFAALTPEADIEVLAPSVAGFKLFMGSTTGEILLNDDRQIANLMPRVAATGKVLSVHAEDDDMIGNDNEEDTWDHLRNRPIESEIQAIGRLSPYKAMNVNICHATSVASLQLARSLGFTTEVTTHHLLFNATNGLGAKGMVNPPLRDVNTQRQLFKAFKEGWADMIGSDHAPHSISDKGQEFQNAPSGMPGIETAFPMLMAFVKRGMLPLSLVVEMVCENPAKRFNLNKGRIEEGYDADFAIFDPRDMVDISVKMLHGKSEWTPYEGRKAVFADTIILGGELQLDKGELCGEPIGRDLFFG